MNEIKKEKQEQITDHKQRIFPFKEADTFDQGLIAKIKAARIFPKPRWHFLLKNYIVWASGILALLIGAAAVSVLAFLLTNNDWGTYQMVEKSRGEFLLLTLPYFWLFFLGLFIFIIYYNVKHTKRGYRYPVWSIIVASILASIILGGALYLSGLGEKIDSVLGRHAPFYDRIMNPQLEFWSDPAEGRLVGLPVGFTEDGQMILIDRDRQEWEVALASSTANDFAAMMTLAEDAVAPPVRLVGEQISDQEFVAEIVMPLHPGRAFFDRPGHNPQPFRQMPNNDQKLPGPGNEKVECQEKGNSRPCVLPNEGYMRSQPSSKN